MIHKLNDPERTERQEGLEGTFLILSGGALVMCLVLIAYERGLEDGRDSGKGKGKGK